MTSLVNKGLRSSCAKSLQVHFFHTICLHRIKGSLLKMKSVQNNITQRIQIGVSHLWTHTRRWRRISVRLLLRCYVHKVMFTLYQEWSIRSCSHFVDTTKQRHRTGTSRSQTSNIVPERLIERVWVLPVPIHTPEHLLPSHWISVLFSCLFTPLWSKYRFALHQSVAQNLIRHVTLSFGALRGTAALCYRNHAEITLFMCEQKPYPVWFSCRCKSYRI